MSKKFYTPLQFKKKILKSFTSGNKIELKDNIHLSLEVTPKNNLFKKIKRRESFEEDDNYWNQIIESMLAKKAKYQSRKIILSLQQQFENKSEKSGSEDTFNNSSENEGAPNINEEEDKEIHKNNNNEILEAIQVHKKRKEERDTFLKRVEFPSKVLGYKDQIMKKFSISEKQKRVLQRPIISDFTTEGPTAYPFMSQLKQTFIINHIFRKNKLSALDSGSCVRIYSKVLKNWSQGIPAMIEQLKSERKSISIIETQKSELQCFASPSKEQLKKSSTLKGKRYEEIMRGVKRGDLSDIFEDLI